MDEIPFAVDAAKMCVTRIVIEVGTLAIEQRVSIVSDRKITACTAPAPICMLERENMEQ